MGTLKERIREDMKSSMKGGDKERLAVIRLIMAGIKQIEVDRRIELNDAQVIEVLDKMLKQRRESIKQFNDAGRNDLAEVEMAEVDVIQDFLPQALTDAEIDAMIMDAISDTGAGSIKEMGKVMAVLKPKMTGRADMSVVSSRIKAKLT